MKYPDKTVISKIKAEYPIGTRIELLKMDDIQAPPIGTKGVVEGIDDMANVLVRWDNGSGLNVIYNCDIIKKI
ncbi:MAG: DUF4314 domain-containing protein [Ruminococcus sp.]|nr:DUF4314 domain-containing protein [Ruminococcus sp.]MBQ9808553.1 DUF4314 domain-containing protein [Ruminococcus sp.]